MNNNMMQSNNTTNHQSNQTPIHSKSLKTLSRSHLYTPIHVYLPDEKNKSNCNNNVKDKDVYSFLEEISIQYHSCSFTGNTHSTSKQDSKSKSKIIGIGGNNGGQPLKQYQIEAKLAQRALTLIGNGIGNSIATSTTSLIDPSSSNNNNNWKKKRKSNIALGRIPGSLSHRERKRRIQNVIENDTSKGNDILQDHDATSFKTIPTQESNNQVQKHAKTCQSNLSSSYYEKSTLLEQSRIQIQILISLHGLWKSYIQQLLSATNTNKSLSSSSSTTYHQSISSLLSTCELVGAYVHIHKCHQHSNYTGMSGFVIEVTCNTWQIVVIKQGGTKPASNGDVVRKQSWREQYNELIKEYDSQEGISNHNNDGSLKLKVVCVPKLKSILWLSVNVDTSHEVTVLVRGD